MIVTFSRRAERDLDEILDGIAARASRRVALRMLTRIEKRCGSLDQMSDRGARFRQADLDDLRYLLEGPYVIVYGSFGSDTVEIVTILHGSRDVIGELLRLRT